TVLVATPAEAAIVSIEGRTGGGLRDFNGSGDGLGVGKFREQIGNRPNRGRLRQRAGRTRHDAGSAEIVSIFEAAGGWDAQGCSASAESRFRGRPGSH
ncbi:MAG TPA: hypothetical protein VFT13_10695, partial [Candidatus Krumholzibacteria bacterium]|nr:hypothetical protein [Candidatus Krumholzibacteria bacterium]